jgi:hypothetical protein
MSGEFDSPHFIFDSQLFLTCRRYGVDAGNLIADLKGLPDHLAMARPSPKKDAKRE